MKNVIMEVQKCGENHVEIRFDHVFSGNEGKVKKEMMREAVNNLIVKNYGADYLLDPKVILDVSEDLVVVMSAWGLECE